MHNRIKRLLMLSVRSSILLSYHDVFELNSKVKRSQYDHPELTGFTYLQGMEEKTCVSQNTSGYYYYDSDVYYSQLTDVSRLYIIRVRVNFTSGFIAYRNRHTEYEEYSYLSSGFVHINPYQKKENSFKRSSTFKSAKSWPTATSDSLTYSVSNSYGSAFCFSDGMEAGVKYPSGASISEKSEKSITFNFDSTTTVYGKEPTISVTNDPHNSSNTEWVYAFSHDYAGTFQRDCYDRILVKNDGIVYQNYSFDYQVDIRRTNTSTANPVTASTFYGFVGTY